MVLENEFLMLLDFSSFKLYLKKLASLETQLLLRLGGGLNDGLWRAAEEHSEVPAVSSPELPAGHGQGAAGAVPDKDGALDGAQHDLAVLAVVDAHGVDVVEEVDAAVLAVLNDELLAWKQTKMDFTVKKSIHRKTFPDCKSRIYPVVHSFYFRFLI